MRINLQLSAFVLFLLTLALENVVEGRGARFGGIRSSSSFRSSSNYRSGLRNNFRSTRSTRYGTGVGRYRGTRYGKYAAAAAAGYAVYGMSRYRSRYSGSRHYRSDPNICTNLDRYVVYDNKSRSTTQRLTYFVCPYYSTDASDATYCCGPKQKQTCCSYWKSGKKTGAIIGIVVGIFAFIGIMLCLCKACSNSRKESGRDSSAAHYIAQSQVPDSRDIITAQPNAPPSYPVNPQSAGYPPPEAGAYPPPEAGMYPPPEAGMYPPPQAGAYPPPQAGAYPPPQPMDYTTKPSAPNAIGFEGNGSAPPAYETVVGYPTKS